MSDSYATSLLTLPVEILHHIMDYLDVRSILLSLSNVCTYFRAISGTYNRYQLNLMSISKLNFHRICQLFQPITILSLTLSDDNRTPGQIRLFLSLFTTEQFTRLHSLTLLGIDDNDLNQILYSDLTSTLTSLIINWREAHCPTSATMDLLSLILSRTNLQKLELKTGSYALEEMRWPVQRTLNHLTLMYITQKQFCTILRQTPNLRTLVLNHCSMHKLDEDMVTSVDPILYEQLTSLILIDSRMTMNGLTSILIFTPSLTHLKIIGLPDVFDTIADGFRWEQFIRLNLLFLRKFEFLFTNMYNVYYRSRNIELLISRFQTPFWLEEKHWFVTCDYIDYLNQVMLYTTPLCTTDFTYECEANKISHSTLTTNVNNDPTITDNVRTINLTLTKLLAGVTTTKNIAPNHYLFRNVTKLTIDVDQEWSSECVQYLSSIVDLSKLDKLILNPDLNPEFIQQTIDNINILLELACNLNCLAIHPYSSSDSTLSVDNICAIIPQHIKYLEMTIKDIETMKMILDHHRHLWGLTLLAFSDQSMPWSEFIDELMHRKKDFVYWESYYSLRIWFG